VLVVATVAGEDANGFAVISQANIHTMSNHTFDQDELI